MPRKRKTDKQGSFSPKKGIGGSGDVQKQQNGSADQNNLSPQQTTASSSSDKMNRSKLKRVATVYQLDKLDRQKLVLWRRPFTTLKHFIQELFFLIRCYGIRLLSCWKQLILLVLFMAVIASCYYMPGAHQKIFDKVHKKLLWCCYWVGLGILSSVGLGTGLHTFLLYLGPHIASVTLAAYECDTLKFPEPPYPDEIVCPDAVGQNGFNRSSINNGSISNSLESVIAISMWSIMSKVRLEAFMWGAGTALGELPPYFMAKAARLSGQEPDDEEYREFENLLENHTFKEQQHWSDRAKLFVERLVESVGFVGILLCASIPNPLFDLAGITCGHFLVPFWTFFGATLIGKAVIKMHVQKIFVITIFSEHHVEKMVHLLKYIPKVGHQLQQPFKEYLSSQKSKLHHKLGDPIRTKQSWLQFVFEKFVMLMIIYFVVSIINSMAQSYHKRLSKDRLEMEKLR